MIEILYISILILIFVIIYILYLFLGKLINLKENQLILNKIDKHKSYLSVLEYYMAQSYSIVYKEKILVYSIEASRLPQNELNAVAKDYISLTIKFIGPKLEKEFVDFFGNYDTLYFNIGQYFYFKYEDDKIRESYTNEIMDSNDLDETEPEK